VAIGTCYVDTNVANFPFSRNALVGEELIGDRYEIVPGGSAVNFCRLGRALGLRTAFIGMVGSDANGDMLQSMLAQQGVQSALVRRPDLQTNIGFNLTNNKSDHLMFVAGTANAALDPPAVLPPLKELLPEATMLYLGGCLKLKTLAPAYSEIITLARQASTQLAVDHGRIPEGAAPEILRSVKDLVLNATYYFPSREEFCTLWEVASIHEGLHHLQELSPGLTVVVKDGPHGAFYWIDGAVRHLEVAKIDAITNATGAGDSFNAGVIMAVLKGTALPTAVAYGHEVAAAKLQAQPTGTFSPPMLR